MFNKKFISHLEEEIKFLREQNKRLQNMIIALKGKSIEYNNIIANSDEIKDPLKELEIEINKYVFICSIAVHNRNKDYATKLIEISSNKLTIARDLLYKFKQH